MSDVVVSVVESETNVVVSEQDVAVDVTENVVQVSVSTAGIQGVPGANNDPTYVTVRNATGATLAKGTIVYISGANGNNVQVTPAIATSDATSARTLGWLAVSIPNNGSGLCMVEGYLEGLNTQSFNAGDQLYLSGTVAGGFTATKPVAPIHLVYVGVVTKKSAGDGHVFVKVQNGYELGELHDVAITNPTNNQVLAYDSATQLWKNATNAPDGVTSITATAPLTGGTITSTGSIGLDQTALSITKSQVSDFTSGTVTSASTAQQAGTAVYAVNSGTAVYATTSGTATYSTNAGTAVYSTTSGTAVTISGDITKSQVSDFTSGTVASAGTAQQSGTAVFATTSGTATYATNSGTAVFATNASTAVTISGSIAQSQVTNLTTDLAGKANLAGGNAFTGAQTITSTDAGQFPLSIIPISGQTASTFRVRNAANTGDLFSVDSSGNLRSPALINLSTFNNSRIQMQNTGVLIDTQIATNLPLAVRAASGQTENIQVWQSSAPGTLARVSQNGSIATSGNLAVGQTAITNANQLQVTATSATQIGAVIRGAAAQSAHLLQAQNSAGTVLAGVSASGRIFTGTAPLSNAGGQAANISVLSDATTVTPLIVRSIASQTANLQEWQDSASNPVAWVSSAGTFVSSQSTGFSIIGAASFGSLNAGQTVRLQAGSGVAANAQVVVRGVSGATGNLQEWQDSASAVKGYIDRFGDMSIGSLGLGFVTPYSSYGNSLLSINTVGAGNKGIVVRAVASPTADLQQWQDSAGNNNVSISPTFGLVGRNAGNLSYAISSGAGLAAFYSQAPTNVLMTLRGAASQTGNLQEWQNSAGTILARMTSAGVLRASQLLSLNALASMGEFNNGAIFEFVRATAASYSPGANRATLYFRDGTNAGTLRLVVRAGAAGAETTIFDNIPQ